MSNLKTTSNAMPSSAVTRQLLSVSTLPVLAFGGEDGNDEDVSGCYVRGIQEWRDNKFISIFGNTFTNALPVSMQQDGIVPLPAKAIRLEDIDGIACPNTPLAAICWASHTGDIDDAYLEIIDHQDHNTGEWISRTCDSFTYAKPVTLNEFQQLHL